MNKRQFLRATCTLIITFCTMLLFIIVVDKWDEIVRWYKETQREAELVRQQEEILRRLAEVGIR